MIQSSKIKSELNHYENFIKKYLVNITGCHSRLFLTLPRRKYGNITMKLFKKFHYSYYLEQITFSLQCFISCLFFIRFSNIKLLDHQECDKVSIDDLDVEIINIFLKNVYSNDDLVISLTKKIYKDLYMQFSPDFSFDEILNNTSFLMKKNNIKFNEEKKKSFFITLFTTKTNIETLAGKYDF